MRNEESLRNAEVSIKERLLSALQKVAHLYDIDPKLVEAGAKAHHTTVTVGDMFTPPELGKYNARLPQGNAAEIDALEGIKSITVMCEDFRQSGQVVSELKLSVGRGADAIFASAGGAAQPEAARRAAAVEMIAAIYALNKNVVVRLVVHTNVCGGADHFTEGQARAEHDKSLAGEKTFMKSFENQMFQELVAAGVPKDSISMYVSNVREDNSFEGLENA